jgi:hypothetical protein
MCEGGKREERSDRIGCVTKGERKGEETINTGTGGGDEEGEEKGKKRFG